MHKRHKRGVGIDITDISRFRGLEKTARRHSLKKLFTEGELSYCLRYKDPAPHLAGIFSAKEASTKALGTREFTFLTLEIRHKKDGSPEAWSGKKRLPIRISITHSDTMAAAVAVS